ncbi:MAG: extracellular solute-binding protein [Hyphomicrobiaceae bacterium]|nr:extracellular solute-binding protein [Hyphomicrobiaceae bacterium]
MKLANRALAGMLLAAGGVIAAAPGALADDTVSLTLRYCWGGDAEMAAMESVISAWNDANPSIQVTGIGGSINAEEIVASVAGGTAPDMVIMCDNGAVAGFAHDNVIMPLNDTLAAIGADMSNIIPSSLDWVSYQGKLYGLPFGQDTYALYYNADEFAAAGLDPSQPPKTWEELWTYAEKLTKWNADGSLAQVGFIPTDPSNNIEQTSALFNCDFYDAATNKIIVNSQACVDWFKWYKTWFDAYNKDGALVNVIASRTGGDAGLLITGQQAMGIFGEWNTGKAYIPTNGPDLNYDTAPIPAIDPAKYGAGFMNGNAFLVTSSTRNPEAAAKFGMYLMTDNPSRTMALQNASVPQLKSLLTDPALTSIPHFQAFLDIANHPQAWTTPMISVYGELRDGLTNALDAVINGGADPQATLDELASGIQARLDANGP